MTFSRQERDSETGLDYFGPRYYGSNMGRWISPDWSASPEAVPYNVGYEEFPALKPQ